MKLQRKHFLIVCIILLLVAGGGGLVWYNSPRFWDTLISQCDYVTVNYCDGSDYACNTLESNQIISILDIEGWEHGTKYKVDSTPWYYITLFDHLLLSIYPPDFEGVARCSISFKGSTLRLGFYNIDSDTFDSFKEYTWMIMPSIYE